MDERSRSSARLIDRIEGVAGALMRRARDEAGPDEHVEMLRVAADALESLAALRGQLAEQDAGALQGLILEAVSLYSDAQYWDESSGVGLHERISGKLLGFRTLIEDLGDIARAEPPEREAVAGRGEVLATEMRDAWRVPTSTLQSWLSSGKLCVLRRTPNGTRVFDRAKAEALRDERVPRPRRH